MDTKKALLLKSAAQLYRFGIELDHKKEKLKQLVEAGASYHSPEMLQAFNDYTELKAKWERLEQEHLALKADFESSQGANK